MQLPWANVRNDPDDLSQVYHAGMETLRRNKDVITQLEPGLFKKVTGLSVTDFELLVSLGVFNDSRMNNAVYKFRRYEDSSLTYAGVNRHEGERRGLFDTSLTDFEYMAMAQEESMVAPNGLARPGANASKSASTKPTVKPVAQNTAFAKRAVQEPAPAKAAPPSDIECANIKAAVKPAVTQEQLDELEPGDTVFHKAFGYGHIIDIDGSYIKVTFDSDNKKSKPSRKFMFPGAFFQGLLQIG